MEWEGTELPDLELLTGISIVHRVQWSLDRFLWSWFSAPRVRVHTSLTTVVRQRAANKGLQNNVFLIFTTVLVSLFLTFPRPINMIKSRQYAVSPLFRPCLGHVHDQCLLQRLYSCFSGRIIQNAEQCPLQVPFHRECSLLNRTQQSLHHFSILNSLAAPLPPYGITLTPA